MKRNILLLLLLVTTLGTFAQQNGYRVSGTVKGAHDGDTVKIEIFKGWDVITLDSAIVKNGRFTFTGRQNKPAMRYISCGSNGKSLGGAQFILENGDIVVNLDSATFNYDIKGTVLNEAWCKYYNEDERLCGETLDITRQLQDSTLTAAVRAAKVKEQEAKDAEIAAFRKQTCRQNISNVIGAYILCANNRDFTFDETAELVMQIPADVADENVLTLKETVENTLKTALNQPFTDFALDTPDGTKLSVSSIAKKAKVLMIDFWASWCGPCRAEMPNVKAAYAKYHDKGFEILGVSLDNNKEAWLKAINSLGLTWPQVSDLKGWKCEGAELYGVKAIPATVIIVNGKIVARDVRGEAIEQTLSELLK